MRLRGIHKLSNLEQQLGAATTRTDPKLRLATEPVLHYTWRCGCTAVTMAAQLVAWDACGQHVGIFWLDSAEFARDAGRSLQ